MTDARQCKVVRYTVDGELQESSERKLTVNEILRRAGLDPNERYLVEVHCKEQTSYKDEGERVIHLKDGMKFLTVHCGPVPVS